MSFLQSFDSRLIPCEMTEKDYDVATPWSQDQRERIISYFKVFENYTV
ncbi:hypothetical protein [Reichenbachiella sp.]